jgi:8-oxo-dGTP diphosphatase
VSIGRFYGGVAALIWAPDGRYLLLQRAASKDFGAGAWECVTGRVDQGEGFETAVRREAREEVGVIIQVEFIIGTTHFYRGAVGPENELIGVIYGCSLADPATIQLSPEHEAYCWVTAETADALLAGEANTQWLRQSIARAEQMKRQLPASLLAYYREHGFEIGEGL